MPSRLPINLQDLLHRRTVEGERIEYRAGWNPDPILRTLCAFANADVTTDVTDQFTDQVTEEVDLKEWPRLRGAEWSRNT